MCRWGHHCRVFSNEIGIVSFYLDPSEHIQIALIVARGSLRSGDIKGGESSWFYLPEGGEQSRINFSPKLLSRAFYSADHLTMAA